MYGDLKTKEDRLKSKVVPNDEEKITLALVLKAIALFVVGYIFTYLWFLITQ